MNLHSIPNDVENELYHMMLSENESIFMGVYRVAFGFRVRSGFYNKPWCELDWCAGSDWNNVQRLYSILFAILAQREESTDCFKNLPGHSRVKPFYNDLEFTQFVLKEAGSNLKMIDLNPILV